jgi:hypothetical protein
MIATTGPGEMRREFDFADDRLSPGAPASCGASTGTPD